MDTGINCFFQGYAIETPFERSPASSLGDSFVVVKIDFNTNSSIAAINFVLKVCSAVLLGKCLFL